MTTTTTRLGLNSHTTTDVFHIADYAANWAKLDQYPGFFICTAATRPAWGAPQAGMAISETDTGLAWRWTGSAWVRTAAKGLLGQGERTTDYTNATSVYSIVVSAANVAVPAGNRTLLVIVEGPSVMNTNGITEIAIFRDATQLQAWKQYGDNGGTPPENPEPLSMVTIDSVGAGTYTFSLQARANATVAGTSTLAATPNTPIGIDVVEV